jgi:2-methylisocitrate lyase-like PEP mutase family enzyme
MTTDRAEVFRQLHEGPEPLVLPNPWDVGSARLLASLGFTALATTSGGFAAALGRLDGSVNRDEAVEHAAAIVAATDLPVSADLENGFADKPAEVAETLRLAVRAGLAGCSIEDFTGRSDDPIYPTMLAAERITSAAEVARSTGLVLTGRAENYLHGRPDLADTISRLQAYQEAGADVLFAPGLQDLADIRAVVSAVDRPVNVLIMPNGPSVAQLAEAGVRRISIGSRFAFAAYGALVEAAMELRGGSYQEFSARAAVGVQAARAAFSQ